MCGIVGLLARRGPVEREALERATRQVFHRGPDGQRHWVDPSGRVGLGHARLSIIDLEGGAQPLANEDGTVRAVVNGEFYDYERVRRELAARGHSLRTQSDSEILLHLYEDLGTACLEHLRGEFAFILWDEKNGLLFAARDRFGIKPLHYATHGGTLFLGSEAKSLFAAGVPARWDYESFYQRTYVPCNPDRTLFDGVLQVPPGCYLLATRGQTQIVRYWDIEYPQKGERPPPLGEQEFVELFREKLEESIRLRLRADVPVGVFLSGGVDSSAVMGMAAKQAPAEHLHAFTISFQDPEYDEVDVARETARFTGAVFHPVPVDPVSFAQSASDAAWHGETVTLNSNSIARYLKARAVHDAGYRVVLCGEGADEILAGYRPLEQELLRPEERAEDVPHWRATRYNEQLGALQPILGGVPLFLRDAWFAQRSLRAVLAPGFLADFERSNPLVTMLGSLDGQRDLVRWAGPHQAMYLWSKLHLSNYILYADRMEMAHSVEVRLPFLDHHLFEIVQKMPLSIYKRGQKWLLREAARPFITDTIYGRPKRMFAAPPDATGESAMRELTEEVLRGPALADVPFFDRGAVLKMLDRLRGADRAVARSVDPTLKMVLSTCLLQDRFKIGALGRSRSRPGAPKGRARRAAGATPMLTFYLILAAQIVSTAGTHMTGFAVAVQTYQATRLVTLYGAVVLATLLPGILLGPAAGLLADRWGQRRSLVLAHAGGGAVALLLTAAHALGLLGPGAAVALMFVKASFGALEYPAFSACTTRLVPSERLGRANGLAQAGLGVSLIAAPVAATALVPAIGLGGVLLLDLASFAAALVVLLAVRVPQPAAGAKATGGRGPRALFADVAAGFALLRRRRAMAALLGLGSAVQFNVGMVQILFAPLVLSIADARAYGAVQSVGGLGMLVGSGVLVAWGGPRRPALVVLGFMLLQGTVLLLAVLRPSIYLAGAGAFCVLFSYPFIAGCGQTIWQREIEPGLQGRMFAIRNMATSAALALASVSAGPLTDRVFEPLMADGGALAGSAGALIGTGPGRGAALLVALLGVATVAVVAAGLARPSLHGLGAAPKADKAAEAPP